MADDDAVDDQDAIRRELDQAVGMTAGELEKWLGSEESKSVGKKSGGGESTGHGSGRRIVEILRATKGNLTDDYAHMRKVNGYVERHPAQGRPRRTSRARRGATPDGLGTRPAQEVSGRRS